MNHFGLVTIQRYAEIHGLPRRDRLRFRVLPYKQGSRSAKLLSVALGGKVLRLENSRYRYREGDAVINWGSSRPTDLPVLNHPDAVAVASNKLAFFEAMRDAGKEQWIPRFWTERPQNFSGTVVCRTVLNGHSGEGIVIASNPDELVDAPLYTEYIQKKDEYRVHVGTANRLIAVQRKARKRDVPDDQVNWQIRNLNGGFVFVRGEVNPPACVIEAAHVALAVTGLDFGAVDVVYNESRERAYVLEVNTAPGLEGQTVHDYADYFMREER